MTEVTMPAAAGAKAAAAADIIRLGRLAGVHGLEAVTDPDGFSLLVAQGKGKDKGKDKDKDKGEDARHIRCLVILKAPGRRLPLTMHLDVSRASWDGLADAAELARSRREASRTELKAVTMAAERGVPAVVSHALTTLRQLGESRSQLSCAGLGLERTCAWWLGRLEMTVLALVAVLTEGEVTSA